MVVGSKVDVCAQQVLPPAVEKTIRSIKEIVGNHSDDYIYAMLKETDMDPNETTQKLLYQDPFHEVKRKRDKKKEIGWQTARDGARQVPDGGRAMEGRQHTPLMPVQNTGIKGSTEPRKRTEHMAPWTKSHTSWDRNARRGGYVRNTTPGISREFRVVRDNRLNQNTDRDANPETPPHAAFGNEQAVGNTSETSSSGVLANQKHSAARNSEGKFSSQGINGPHKPNQDLPKDADLSGTHGQSSGETQPTVSNSSSHKEVAYNSQLHSASRALSNSAIGIYASSSDPVHVPSPDSRSAGTVGAIRREVGVVGVRRQSSERTTAHSSAQHSSFSVPLLGKDTSSSTESSGHSTSISKNSQLSQSHGPEPIMSGIPVTRPFSSHQYNNKLHQQSLGHQKAPQPNMEWKPKSSQKTASSGVFGTASAPSSSCPDNSTRSMVETTSMSDKLSQVNILENKHVIIPQHLRVPEAEKSGLTFGSFGAGFDSTKGFTSAFQAFGNMEESINEPSVSTSASVPVGSSDGISAGDQEELVDDQARTSRSDSPVSATVSEQPQPENIDPLSPRSVENYSDIGLVQSHSPSYNPSEQQMQNPSGLPSFSEAYDPQSSYDVPFFRSAMEENVHGHRLTSPSEVLHSHVANISPPSSLAMVQQQQLAQPPAVAQLYPQVHIPHFPNFVPYRQFLSPLYVPPMAMPNYTNNPAYPPHPSNGSSYLLMPGASSHLTAGGMKYATSQYKPVPGGSPTAYGNYSNPAGYAISAPGTVGAATGLDDVSRIKYKDNSLYVPNPQAETSELWIQTPRDLSSMQSAAPYYNLSGQAPHTAYLPTHTGHASFNAAAQSSHVQFPGLYHPPQQATMANPHHLVHQQVPPGMGGNVGVGVAAPGPQVGTYQQPQLGHLNWTGNF